MHADWAGQGDANSGRRRERVGEREKERDTVTGRMTGGRAVAQGVAFWGISWQP